MSGSCLYCDSAVCDVKRSSMEHLLHGKQLYDNLAYHYYSRLSLEDFERLVSLYDMKMAADCDLHDCQQEDLRRLHLYILDHPGPRHQTIEDLLFCKDNCKPDKVYYPQDDYLLILEMRQHLNTCLLPVLVDAMVMHYVGVCTRLFLDDTTLDYDFVCPACVPDYLYDHPLDNVRVDDN